MHQGFLGDEKVQVGRIIAGHGVHANGTKFGEAEVDVEGEHGVTLAL